MPKNRVETKRVNKKIFLKILKLRGLSIRKLGDVEQNLISASEKTIRRQLNEGGMRPLYIKEIAKYVNVDSRILTGELFYKFNDDYICEMLTKRLDEYPYFREEREAYIKEGIDKMIAIVLSIFNRDYSQFEKKDTMEQFLFQEEFFNAIWPVVKKHFEFDGLGNKNNLEEEWVFYALEDAKETYLIERDADTRLRQQFLSNLPRGYTREEISKMPPSQLIDIDLSLQQSVEETDFEQYLKEKYAKD